MADTGTLRSIARKAQATRQRGRPRGARTQVLRPGLVLGADHFAFLRAGLQGVDLRQAWQRYLGAASAAPDLRQIERLHHTWLVEVVERAARQAASVDPGHPLHDGVARLRMWVAGRSGGVRTPSLRARSLPSLENFLADSGLDPDMYTEAELQREYRLHYGLDATAEALSTVETPPAQAAGPDRDAPPTHRQLLRALNLVEGIAVSQPHPDDPLARWLAGATLRPLHAAGLHTLDQLCSHVIAHGHRWALPLRGLGAVRATALEAWLGDLRAQWQRPWPAAEWASAARARRRHLGLPPADGGRRALDDSTTVDDWLQRFATQPNTARAYRKEAERLQRWALHVRGLPLTALVADDLVDYQRFLAAPPADWVQATALPRSDPDWRPFRCALSPASQSLALKVARQLLAWLVGAGLSQTTHRQAPRTRPTDLHVTDSTLPTGDHGSARDSWVARRRHGLAAPGWVDAGDEPACTTTTTAAGRRMRLALHLMRCHGVSPPDLASACIECSGSTTPVSAIRLQLADGRRIALSPPSVEMLLAHHADLVSPQAPRHGAPLLLALRSGVARWRAMGDAVALVRPQPLAPGRALGWPALQRALARWRRGRRPPSAVSGVVAKAVRTGGEGGGTVPPPGR